LFSPVRELVAFGVTAAHGPDDDIDAGLLRHHRRHASLRPRPVRHPAAAARALGHEGSTVLVGLNGQRLLSSRAWCVPEDAAVRLPEVEPVNSR
jgi:hypothetical protein